MQGSTYADVARTAYGTTFGQWLARFHPVEDHAGVKMYVSQVPSGSHFPSTAGVSETFQITVDFPLAVLEQGNPKLDPHYNSHVRAAILNLCDATYTTQIAARVDVCKSTDPSQPTTCRVTFMGHTNLARK